MPRKSLHIADENAPKTVADLMKVTGLGRDSVKAAIRTGELPGYLVGSRYVVPADAYDAFCAGTWVPQYRPVFSEPIRPLNPVSPVRSVRKAS